MSLATDPAAALLNARLSPHRSFPKGNFRLLLVVVLVLSLAVSLPFVLLGAWPIAGFMGLDVLLLCLAFRANYRSARAYETVFVSALELRVDKVSARGRRREWRFHPWWTRLAREDDDEFGLQKLALVSRNREVEIAAFLGPGEKEDFARILTDAMAQARRGAFYS